MSKPIKLGIVGIGRAGWGMHLREIEGKKDMFEVVAVCDVIPERCERAKNRLGCRIYESIDELLNDEEVEIVDIATRSCDHLSHALKSLSAGKDVLLEKPACTSYEEFEELMKHANKPGLPRLFFRQNRRFELGFAELKKLINSGVLGHVFEMRLSESEYQRRNDWQTLSKYGGGQLNNWGPHLFDHALQLLNSPVVNVSGNRIHAAAGGDCEDHFYINLTAESGCHATVSVSGSTALDGARLYVINGSKGTAVMKNYTIKVRYINPEQTLPPVISSEDTPNDDFGSTGTFKAATELNWIEKTYEITGQDLSVFWEYLYESYRNNKPFPIRDEEVDALMRVISSAKKVSLVKADNI